MTPANPFTERARITTPEHFAGRWSELGLIFERIEGGRPVLVSGTPGIGKSSLLTHITQAAAVNLEIPELRAYYLDMHAAEDAAQIYATLARSLGQAGDTLAALELGLVAVGDPVLICLDNAQAALAAGWGEGLLEALARVARGGQLMLVVAMVGTPPPLSERFALLTLGALAQTEVRLLAETYLDGTGVEFSGQELREIADLSAAHPAYVQRAAYYLFEHKLNPQVDWRVAYRTEARDRPIPGAPLPPSVFEGGSLQQLAQSSYGSERRSQQAARPELLALPEAQPLVSLLIGLVAAVLAYLSSGSWLLALAVALAVSIVYTVWSRPRRAG